MIIIPVRDREKNTHMLAVVIEESNLERMKNGDPITIFSQTHGGTMPAVPLESLMICYATAEDMKRLTDLAKANDIGGILRYLRRGYKFDPALGDGMDAIRVYGNTPEKGT